MTQIIAARRYLDIRWLVVFSIWFLLASSAFAKNTLLKEMEGFYSGSAEIVRADGSTSNRDMSVAIETTRDGFEVAWSTTSIRANGSVKEKDYVIEFVPSERENVYSAAMERNVFGHEVQLDPMKGEPFVWARTQDATLTVFSLFVDEAGDYELQQFDRTLVEGGLKLEFRAVRNGQVTRSVNTFLARQ